jgi:regulator of nonsense transcripts 1
MTNERGEEFIGRADGVEGRTTDIKFGGAGFRGQLTKVCVVGKEELTNAERARVEFILLALRGELNVKDSLFIGFLWLPHPTHAAELAAPPEYETGDYLDSSLNRSQIQALGRMTSAMPIVTVQGESTRISCMI